MRADKLILGLALVILALTLRCPAHAADQARTLSLGGAGPTWTDIAFQACDSNHVIVINRGATVGTSAGRLITLSPLGVTTFSLPATEQTYGLALAVGCDATTIVVGGGNLATNGTRWVYKSTIAAPGTWTKSQDQVDTGYASLAVGRFADGLGAQDWTVGYLYSPVPGNDWVYAYNITPNNGSVTYGSAATYDTGGNTFTNQCSGDRASSTHYGTGCWASGALYLVGFNGTTTTYSNSLGPIGCGGLATGTLTARQSFGAVGASNAPIVHLGYNGTDAYACVVTWNGSSASRAGDQVLSSLSMVGGAYFASQIRLWSSAGIAYVGGGSVASYFSNEGGSTYDFACSSGVLSGVVQGVDVDLDTDATDNLLGFCTDGNLVYFGEALPSLGLPATILMDDPAEIQ